MKVYVVTSGDYSDYRLEGIFSTKKKAETFSKEVSNSNGVDICEVDERVGETRQIVYACKLRIIDGSLIQEWNYSQLVRGKYSDCIRSYYNQKNKNSDFVVGYSSVSLEHARKVAAEGRQKWLREMGVKPESSDSAPTSTTLREV